MKKTILLTVFTVVFSLYVSAQGTNKTATPDYADHPYWIEMMQDPGVNFFDVQHAFYTYWEGREITRSNGYKPFKRWEYRMRWRVKPNGDRYPENHVWNEYHKFMENNPAAKSPSGDWENLGPFTIPNGKGYRGLGRLNAIAFHPTDPDIIFAGAPAGGLWITHDGGASWTSYCDGLPTLGVSAIAVDYTNPDIIYMGTGDRDAGDAAGIGVLKSTDGGINWSNANTGIENRTVGRMIMHPTNPDILYIATNYGIYITTDAAQSWTQQIGGNFKEIVFKENDPATLFASKSGDFYKTTDGGNTWNKITNGLSTGARGVIAVTPANTEVVYFLVTGDSEFDALYRSTDAGDSFTEMSDSPNIMSWGCEGGSGGQAWYDLDIAADPLNENIIFAGGVNCFKSSDGGATWQISSHWWGDCGVPAVHADLHVLEYNPVDGRLYAGNDGGIYWTANGGTNWTVITDGMPISQVYKIGQSATVKDLVINGYQDNGTSTYNGNGWDFTRGGDGFECIIDHTEPQYSYASLYYGSVARYLNNNFQTVVCENGQYGIDESGAWITPFILDEHNANVMFIGYKNIWRSNNVKAGSNQISWKKISDNLGGTNGNNMAVLEQSPANTNILYAGRYDDKVFRTDDAFSSNPLWYNITQFLPQVATPGDIEAHPHDENIVYILLNSSVYKSEDKGLSWTDISGSLPDVHKTSIAFYKNSNEGLYVSSDLGVFYKEEGMDDWIWFNDGLPVDASVNEIEIFYHPDSISKDVIRAGTYGRGMWSSDLWSGAPTAAFTSSETLIPPGCSVDFYDQSGGVPHYFEWTFEGANTVSSSDKNPQGISYDVPGFFEVKLKVMNDHGEDSLIMAAYIEVSETILPEVDFTADELIPCASDVVHFTDQSLNCPNSWQWQFNPGTVTFLDGTSETSQHPVVKFNEAGSYSVTLIAENSNGQSYLTRNDYIHIGGMPLPYEETFENGSLDDAGWTIENPDMKITWEMTEVQGNSPGSNAAWINIFNYYSFGPRDYLVSPPLDLSAFNSVGIMFEHAYASRFSLEDSLIASVSDDCGATWTRIYAASLEELETSPETEESFVPQSADDWCGSGYGVDCNILDLTPWAGQSGIKIRFESFGRYGNNIYIDNVQVSNAVAINEPTDRDAGILIYPNPSDATFNIVLPERNGSVSMQVSDMHGKVLYSAIIGMNENTAIFDGSNFRPGIYVMQFTASGFSVNKKIIIQ
ncbi:MAG: T9SS type A sorting domain-containing protein [Bacteroidales bacterium]|nr:T9SS type A sorting domain-containing protein [Bacteroidales bacterium]